MAKYLGIDLTLAILNNTASSKELCPKAVLTTPSATNRPAKSSTNSIRTENFTTPINVIKRRERIGSVNESLNNSISGTSALRIDKRNAKGETQLHVVSQMF